MSWLRRLHMWPTRAGPGSSTSSKVHRSSQPCVVGSMSYRTRASGRFRQMEDQVTSRGFLGLEDEGRGLVVEEGKPLPGRVPVRLDEGFVDEAGWGRLVLGSCPQGLHVTRLWAATHGSLRSSASATRTRRSLRRRRAVSPLSCGDCQDSVGAHMCKYRAPDMAAVFQVAAQARWALADQSRREATGPGGQVGAALSSSAANRSPVVSTSDRPQPGPVTADLTPDTARKR